MFSKIAVAVAVYAVTFVCGKNVIDCTRSNECDNGQYTCDGDGCEIKCSGKDSCDDSRFYCTGSCSVECSESYACADTNFYFTGGEVTVSCTGTDSCTNSAFYASNATVVTFDCDANDACEDTGIYMSGDSTFSITCDGSYTCDHLYCYCQGSTGCETEGDLVCHEDSAFDFFATRMAAGLPKDKDSKKHRHGKHAKNNKKGFNPQNLGFMFQQ